MRIIILGLSSCLSACVATVPMGEMGRVTDDSSVIPANEPINKQKTPDGRDDAPSEIRVALPYAINLESALDVIRPDLVPAMPGFEDHLIYTSDQAIRGRIWHRLRLGFFASRAEAEQARKKLSVQYPQAWIVRTSESERIDAARHGLVAGTMVTSPITKPETERTPVAITALDTPVTQLMEVQTPVNAAERPPAVRSEAMQEPEIDAASDRGDWFRIDDADAVSMAVKTRRAQQADADTEITYGREEDESVFVRSTHRGGDLFTLGTAFTQRNGGADLKARVRDNNDQGFWHMNLSSAPSGTGPGFEVEFAQSSFNPETSEDFGSSENRLIKLATQGSWQGYQLGLGYQSVGTEFEKTGKAADKRKKANHPKTNLKKGRQGTEAWISRQFGDLGVKTVAAVYEDQGEDKGSSSYFTTGKLGASLNYTILSWPQLGLTVDYASGRRSSSDTPAGLQPKEVDVESVASSLYYSDSSWSGTLYVEDAAGAGTTNAMDLRTYYVGGSYFPVSTVSVSPSFTYVQEEYTDLGANTDSYAASMTASYKPSSKSKFNFNGYSEYSTQENVDWALDTEYYYSSLGVNWKSDKPKSLIKQWSFEVFHDRYIDHVYSDSNTGGLGLWLTLKSSPSPVNRFVDQMR